MRNPGQWWDRTANPGFWGCDTPGCLARCWAEPMSVRLAANPKSPHIYHTPGIIENGRWTGRTYYDFGLMRKTFAKINATKKPSVWALGFMGDLFCPGSWLQFLDALALEIEASNPSQTLVFTTKNPAELLAWQRRYFPAGLPSNVVCLLSVCTQEEADKKIQIFGKVKGRKGLHCEPMLETLNLNDFGIISYLTNYDIEWLACGPENGPGKRPFDEQWARDLRAQCRAAGVRFFYKAGLLDGEPNQEIDS